jgi:Fur family transcriptional regulator, ferric uptake regulator
MNTNKLEKVLREHKFRLTNQRLAVIKVINNSHDHLTPAAIYDRVKLEYPTIGIVTVYRMLDILSQLKLICRVHSQDDCRSYLLRRSNEHHHHLVCSDCGTVVDITNCEIGSLAKIISKKTGFQIHGHLLEFQGLCYKCLHNHNENN